MFTLPVVAQEVGQVKPRFSGTFQTGPGAGYESSFGSVYGFVPFAQTAGVSTFYGEGRFNLFTDGGGESGNLRAGYRTVLPDSNVVLGSYAGWDIRSSAADETFHQLGLGAEVLGDKWEARINGYIPLGDANRTIASSTTDTGFVVSDLSFVGNRLLFSGQREQSQTTITEAAFGGIDLEGGYQLSKWQSGNLYGYLGLYLIGAEERDTVLGVRGRLQAETDNFLAGIGLQSDGEFGTNVQFSVGFKLGGNGTRKQEETSAESVLARLGQSVERQDVIALSRETKTETIIADATNETAINPETGQPWNFVHVKDGSNSSGTFEDPYGEVTDGTAEIGETGTANDIIYVDSGDSSGMSGFTIPENVKVLSTGVTQKIDIEGIGETQLPGSGTGTLPLVQSTVTMGDNTTLSGFDIQTSEEAGVYATNKSNFSIERNTISTTGSGAYGVYIYGDNSTINNASISGNTITTAGDDDAYGIYVSSSESTINNASISGNTITTAGDEAYGIYVRGNNSTINNNASISGNTITTAGDDAYGISVSASSSASIDSASISGNTITTAGDEAYGIYVNGDNSTINNASISGNTITTEGDDAYGIYVNGSGSAEISGASISGNTITTTGDSANGIDINIDESTVNNASISGNTITTEGDDSYGIAVEVQDADSPINNLSISKNTITTTGESAMGIYIDSSDSTINNASISGNTITTEDDDAHGIYIDSSDSTINNASISGNTITTMGESAYGIFVDGSSSTKINDASISGNTVTTGDSDAHGIYVKGASATEINNASILGNTVITTGEDANSIYLRSSNSTVSGVSIKNNTVPQAGTDSFIIIGVQTSGTNEICIAEFSGNDSQNPNVAMEGGVDLSIENSGAGTFDFVNFANVATTNTGFNEINGTPTSQPTSCP